MAAVACPLCPSSGASGTEPMAVASADAVVAALQAARDAGATSVALRGGELLARPEALDLLRQARALGFAAIELWSSGVALARPGVAEQVVAAGASHLAVALYGDTAAGHDYVAQVDGHFARAVAGLRRARAAGARTAVVAPILRPSFRNLARIVQKSIPIDVGAVHLVAPTGRDRAAHPLLVPLPMAAPYLRAAVEVARAGRRRLTVRGVPACLLADHGGEALATTPEFAADGSQSPAFGHGPPCQTCTWRGPCRGQLVSLAEQHGWLGLAARSDLPPTPRAPENNIVV